MKISMTIVISVIAYISNAQTVLNGNPIYFLGGSTDPNYIIQSGAWNDGMKYKHWTSHQFFTAGSERFRIESNGGANTLGNPIYFLGGPTDPSYLIQSGAWNDGMKYKHWTSHQFFTQGLERFRIQYNGNIGIGTTNATHKLEVLGNDDVAAFISGGSNSYIRLLANAAGGFGERVEFANRGNGKAAIWTPGGGDALTVTRNGNIGIGTDNAVAKLTVDGKILASSVRVAIPGSANWSDYVFAPEYKLQPLEQVEAFIKENKHLPNVPSAEQMVKEGNDLGATDAKLLEKIEELTLYIIEMKKEIDSLKNKIKLLK